MCCHDIILLSMNKFYNIDDYRAANNRKIYTDDGESAFSNPLNPDFLWYQLVYQIMIILN